jgi:hypothetical protein
MRAIPFAAPMIDELAAELRTVAIHATAADRRRRQTLGALREDKLSPSFDTQERAIGEAELSVVAL